MQHPIYDALLAQVRIPSLPTEGFVRLNRITGPTGCMGVSKSTWYTWIARGIAPKPVKLGGASAWLADDIRALMARFKAGHIA